MIRYLFAGIPVSDYGDAVGWYERLFGRSADVIVKDDECMWQVVDAGWVYVVADAERAGHALVTILVQDLPLHVAGLEARDIEIGEMETVPGKFRRSIVSDRDGNRIAFAQAL
jgi:hypothetical protein